MFKGRLRLVAVTHDVTTPTAPSVLTSVSRPSGVVPCHVQHRHDSPPRLEHLTGQEVEEGRRRDGGGMEGWRGGGGVEGKADSCDESREAGR